MAPRKARKTLSRGRPPARHAPLLASPSVRTVIVVAGVAGLAALGIALFGPRRLQDQVVRPIGHAALTPLAAAVAPQADRLWAETRPWRDQVGRLLAAINTEEVREAIAERLTQWLDRFR